MLQIQRSTEDNKIQQKEIRSSEEAIEDEEIIEDEETIQDEETIEDETIKDEDGLFIPEYKRMELKGESESDKDLIIYSLNESLQIHKEIVERIQNEKDDIEDQYEQEKMIIKKECIELEDKRDEGKKKINKLELIYNSLLKDLETKKLEYRRMETRFYSHIKSTEQEETNIYSILDQMISQINNLCNSLGNYLRKDNIITIDSILSFDWLNPNNMKTIIQNHFINQLNDAFIISLFTEKFIIDIIINNILQTSIHPGVTLNDSFQIIHDWIDKRNTCWASRLKQQITNFIVNQSNEQSNEIESKKQDIISNILNSLTFIYHDIQHFNSNLTQIIDLALKLNLAIKSQQDKFDILNLNLPCQFNSTIMNSMNETSNEIILVITPPFVADGSYPFIIPAKVYCA